MFGTCIHVFLSSGGPNFCLKLHYLQGSKWLKTCLTFFNYLVCGEAEGREQNVDFNIGSSYPEGMLQVAPVLAGKRYLHSIKVNEANFVLVGLGRTDILSTVFLDNIC